MRPNDITDLKTYFATHTVGDYLEHHWPETTVSGSFSVRARQCLLGCLQRMDTIDRNDPFWSVSNRQVTLYKVSKFVKTFPSSEQQGAGNQWALVALGILWGTDALAASFLADLYRVDPFDVVDMLKVIYRHTRKTGEDWTGHLSEFAHLAGIRRSVSGLISQVQEIHDKGLRDWLTEEIKKSDQDEAKR